MANVFQDKLHLATDCRYRNRKHNCEVSGLLVFPRVWQNVRYELLNRSSLRTVKALDTAQENKLACDGKSQAVLRF